MPLEKDDLSREIMLDVDAAGHVTIRARAASPPLPGMRTVFSTDTVEQAEALRNRLCLPDGPNYVLKQMPKDVDDLMGHGVDVFRWEYEHNVTRSGIDTLRLILRNLNDCPEDFLTRFTLQELVKIGLAHLDSDVDEYPDQWPERKLRQALVNY